MRRPAASNCGTVWRVAKQALVWSPALIARASMIVVVNYLLFVFSLTEAVFSLAELTRV